MAKAISRPRADTTQALRRLVARRDGYKCYICSVPTAATLDHVHAWEQGGRTRLENLRLACPYCNSAKGDRPVEDFIASGRWQVEPPEDLPDNTRDMLAQCFSWRKREGTVYTGSTNAQLEFKHGKVAVLVRAGDRDGWHRLFLGPQAHPKVALAAWDFLRRHNTPPRPRRAIPKSQLAKMTKKGAVPVVAPQIVPGPPAA